MEVIRTIRPGDPGSVRFLRRWGDRLIAVRYRRDTQSNRICTTVELIMNERELSPSGSSHTPGASFKQNQVVAVPIAWSEHELRNSAKRMGARWSPERKVWIMRYHIAVGLGVRERVRSLSVGDE